MIPLSPAQFDGLLDELMGKLDVFVKRVEARGVQVTNFGMVDCAQAAYALLPWLQAADLDLVFCDMVTYATSSTFGILIRDLDVPVVLVALQPRKALDYTRAFELLRPERGTLPSEGMVERNAFVRSSMVRAFWAAVKCSWIGSWISGLSQVQAKFIAPVKH